jgi:transposase InsO family protein
MCATLSVSLSGYQAWKRGGTPNRKRLTDAQLLALIRAVHAELKGAYGSPRMVREIRGRGFPASKARIERLMRENGIRARHKRRYKATTDSRHNLPVAPNLLDRQFTPCAPNRVWTADLTYIWTDEGWRYLAVVLDLFNREVVGWRCSESDPKLSLLTSRQQGSFQGKLPPEILSSPPPPDQIPHRCAGCAYAPEKSCFSIREITGNPSIDAPRRY